LAELLTEAVKDVEQVGLQEDEPKEPVTPEGKPETEKLTGCGEPPKRVAVMVFEPV